MRHVWDAIAAVIIALVVITALIHLLQPYVPYFLIGVLIIVAVGRVNKHYRNW